MFTEQKKDTTADIVAKIAAQYLVGIEKGHCRYRMLVLASPAGQSSS